MRNKLFASILAATLILSQGIPAQAAEAALPKNPIVTSKQNTKPKKEVPIEAKNLKPTKLKVNKSTIKIKYGEKQKLTVKVYPATMHCPVKFSVANKKIATVDKKGVVKGKKAGTTTITVQTTKKNKKGKYLYQKCKVKVSHNYKLVKEKKPTCLKGGYKVYECKCCGNGKIISFPTSEKHKYHTIEEVKATCTENGYRKEKCSVCKKTRTKELSFTGHDFSEIVEEKDPTDEESGYIIRKCKRCEETRTEKLYADKTYTVDLGDGKTTTVVGHYEREMEEEMFNAVNEYRKENGKKELEKGFSKLKAAADIRGYEISYLFEHTRPNGERALKSFAHTTNCRGENIAKGSTTVESAMTLFKNSPTHNAGMLMGDTDTLSVSVFAQYTGKNELGKQYVYHYVQFFGWKPYSYQL